MKISLFLFLLVGVSQIVSAQYAHCDSLSGNTAYTKLDGLKNTSLKSYISEQNRQLADHISERKNLTKIPIWLNLGHRAYFDNLAGIQVDIKFGAIQFDASQFFIPSLDPSKPSLQYENIEETPYGISSLDTCFVRINELNVNGVCMLPKYHNDLLNPNRYETVFAIKPIEVYQSEKGDYIYIYLFGKLMQELSAPIDPHNFSYMCKLIFDKEGNYIDRIVERGNILLHFGFNDCPFFKGF